MSKIDKEIVAKLLNLIISKGEAEEMSEGGESYKIYYLNELQASFLTTTKNTFFGLIFNIFDSELILSNNFELLAFNPEEDDGIVISDDKFINFVNKFLKLRIESLEEFNF